MKYLYFSIFISLLSLNSCATFPEAEPLVDNLFTDQTQDFITMTNFNVTPSYIAAVNFETDYDDLDAQYQEKITKVAIFLNEQQIYLLPLGQNYFTQQLQANENYTLSFAFYTEEGATYIYETHDFDTF
jgi:hypothetical protein